MRDALDTWEDELKEREDRLAQGERSLAAREKVVLAEESKEERIKELRELEEVNRKKLADVRAREKKMYDLHVSLERRETEVRERETAVSKREETYKERLKKEFLEEVQRRLPQ